MIQNICSELTRHKQNDELFFQLSKEMTGTDNERNEQKKELNLKNKLKLLNWINLKKQQWNTNLARLSHILSLLEQSNFITSAATLGLYNSIATWLTTNTTSL